MVEVEYSNSDWCMLNREAACNTSGSCKQEA